MAGSRRAQVFGRGRACTLLLAWLLWGWAGPASAQHVSDRPRLRLAVELEGFAPLDKPPDLKDTRAALTAIPRWDWVKGAMAVRASALLRKDAAMPERDRVDVYESYVAIDRGVWRATVGRQFVSWGRADSLRPTDVFKRHDVTDLLDSRELPVDVVAVEVSGGVGTLEAVWAPVFDPDIYSLRADNPWTSLPPVVEVPGQGVLKARYASTRVTPEKTLGTGQVGARYGATVGGWDFSAMAYTGYDRIPTTTQVSQPTLDGATVVLPVVPTHNRVEVFGGDVATTLGRWGLRGEAAYVRTRPVASAAGSRNPSYARLTAGADRTWSGLPVGDSLTVITQYALDTTPATRAADSAVDPRLHPYRHAAVLHATWRVGGTRQLVVKGYANLQRWDHVMQAEWSWQPWDAVTVAVGGDIIGGPGDAFFGRFARRDRLRLRVAFAF